MHCSIRLFTGLFMAIPYIEYRWISILNILISIKQPAFLSAGFDSICFQLLMSLTGRTM